MLGFGLRGGGGKKGSKGKGKERKEREIHTLFITKRCIKTSATDASRDIGRSGHGAQVAFPDLLDARVLCESDGRLVINSWEFWRWFF